MTNKLPSSLFRCLANIQTPPVTLYRRPFRLLFTLNTLKFKVVCELTLWRNGSASDSRSEGCVFESRQGQYCFATFLFSTFTFLQQSMESTYEILTENCIEECKDVTKTPNDNAFEFWYTLISQLMIVLYQDHHIYPSCLARLAPTPWYTLFTLACLHIQHLFRHCSFNLGNVSSETYYSLFSEKLQNVLEGKSNQLEITNTKYSK